MRALITPGNGRRADVALVVVAALALGACASSATATRERAALDAGAVIDVIEEVVEDPLDDPNLRVDCPPGRGDPCGPGRHCIAVGPGSLGLCVRDGSRGGLCRDDGLPCDEAIACVDNWCARNEHFGARTLCGARRCGLNEGCVEVDGQLRCLAYGGAGAYCRQGVPDRCDAGLSCDRPDDNRGRCGGPLGPGQTCSLTGRSTSFCAGDTACAGPPTAVRGVCRRLGQEQARCRADNTCDPGLECQLPIGGATLTCFRAPGPGERCDLVTAGSPRCASGLTCVAGTCRPDGSRDSACRPAEVGELARCDPGLACHRARLVCVTALPPGAACSARANDVECPAGSSCEGETLATTCVTLGTRGGRCRAAMGSAPVCDPGLSCVVSNGAPYCRLAGEQDARCRDTEPRCDLGLRCRTLGGGGALCL